MPDLHALADLGRASVSALWLPLALWTALAGVVEVALRATRSRAALALPVRGAVLAALPLAVAVPAALGVLAPAAVERATAWAPEIQWLPGVVVGDVPGSPAPAGPPALDLVLGLAVVAAALVSAAGLARLAVSLAAVARARRALAQADAASRAAVHGARQRLGVRRPVATVAAPAGAAPFTVGWRRPVVALPADLDDAAREVAALHEMAHVRRADFAWHVAQRAVVAAFAAHPLAHVLGRGLDLDRERAADAVVLDACPGRRRTYADLLFSYASLPAPALALGAAGGSSFLKYRIDAMASPLSPTRTRRLARWGRLGAVLTLVTAAGLAATVASADTPGILPPAGSPDAQVAPRDTTDEVFDVAEVQPRLIGGLEGIQDRLEYPELQHRAGVEGTAILQFVVSQEGTVTDLRVARSTGNDGLDQAAVAAVQSARFEPGRQRGEPVRVRFAVPITFRLGDDGPGDQAAGPRPPAGDGDAPGVFDVAEVQPELIGGLEALQDAVVYPAEARADGVEGTVTVMFVVNETGGVQGAEVVRSPDDRLSEAALAAVRQMRFEPGRQRGEPVKVRFAVPVTFRLSPEERERLGVEAPERGRTIVWDTEFSDDLESLVDANTSMRGYSEAMLRSRVAAGADPFPDLTPGTARVEFTVRDNGRPLIKSIDASTPAMERFGRLRALTTQFQPEAAGRTGTMTVTVTRAE